MNEFQRLFDGAEAQAVFVAESNRLRELAQTARYYRRESKSGLMFAGGAAVVAAAVAAIGFPIVGGGVLLMAAGSGLGSSFTYAVLATKIESEVERGNAKIFNSNAGHTIFTMGLPKPRA